LLGANPAVTNASGIAEITLRSSTNTGISTVTAQASGFIGSVNVAFVAGAPANINVNAAPSTVNPNGTSTVTATLTDAGGNPIAGETITFNLTINASGASLSGPSAVTDILGKATVNYTAGPGTGVDRVRATSVTNASVTGLAIITVDPAAIVVGGVTVTSGASSIVANGTSTTLIRATVRDINGNPISGASVQFARTLGDLLGANPAVTNASGIAEITLRSSTNTGISTVTAQASGFIGSVNVAFVAGAPANINVNAAPSTVNPNGTSTVTATLTDSNNNPIPGETINFDFTINASGASLSATSAVTNVNGQATITYIAGTAQPTQDRVRARSATNAAINGLAIINVDALASVVGSVTVTAGASSLLADGSSTTAIRATVRDVNGNLAPGITVNFATTLGGLSVASAVTNASGVAQVTLTSATNTGTATVTVQASGFFASVNVAFVAGAPANMLLNAVPSTVGPGVTSTVTATLRDSDNRPLAGETITFVLTINVSGASLSAPSAVTNINGQATITYTAGSVDGIDRIRARSVTDTSVTNTVNITVDSVSSPVYVGSLTLTASRDEIIANGSSTAAIRARVLDIDGNPVSGRVVTFTASYGTLSALTAVTGTTGIAEVMLTSVNRTGISVLMASIVDGFSDDAIVNFVPGPPVDANSSITVQPSSIPANGTATAEVTVTLADVDGNPMLDGTSIALYSSRGTITTANPAPTVSGRATFTIRAPFTTGIAEIYLWDYPDISSAFLGFGSITSGDPASILIQSVSHTEIAVTGVGINDNTAITVRVVDETNTTVVNPDISLLITLLAKPNGGEFISGEAPGGGLVADAYEIEIDAATGVATFNLRSGVLPGVVEIRIEVLDSGSPLAIPVVTISPQISIASGPPHTMALSAPTLNAIVDLNTGGDAGIPLTPGFYSRRAGLIVTDRYGNAVANGTVINLGVLDSVISAGTTGSTTAASAVLTDAGATFSTDSVTRGGLVREIEPNDRVVLFDRPAADKSRFVTTPIGVTTLPVTKNYTTTAAGIRYAVGASLIGGAIYGTDGTTATLGTVQTSYGLAQLRLVYPANRHTIHVGDYAPGVDTRYSPLNSARVISVFTSSDENVSMVDEGTLVFSSIAGWKLEALPVEISADTTITLSLVDGGDEVPLPFMTVTYSIKIDTGIGPINVTFSDPNDRTDVFGNILATIAWPTAASGDSATITFYARDFKPAMVFEA